MQTLAVTRVASFVAVCSAIALMLAVSQRAVGGHGAELYQTTNTNTHVSLLRSRAGRTTALWDLEEGGPTDADQGGNYNPVVLDDAVSRRGYPSLVTGWREWGCDGDRQSLETEYECVNHPDNHGANYDDDYWFDSYGGGRGDGRMFSILAYTKLDESPVKLNRANMGGGIPAPPPTYIPPEGASFNTWPNIYTNLKNIDYCTDQFDEITNRVKCIDAFISGPFLK